jgi:hypothetical protein
MSVWYQWNALNPEPWILSGRTDTWQCTIHGRDGLLDSSDASNPPVDFTFPSLSKITGESSKQLGGSSSFACEPSNRLEPTQSQQSLGASDETTAPRVPDQPIVGTASTTIDQISEKKGRDEVRLQKLLTLSTTDAIARFAAGSDESYQQQLSQREKIECEGNGHKQVEQLYEEQKVSSQPKSMRGHQQYTSNLGIVWACDRRLLRNQEGEETSWEEARACYNHQKHNRCITLMCRKSFGRSKTIRVAQSTAMREVKTELSR